MIFALVEKSGRIAQIVAAKEGCFPVHESLKWVEVADSTTVSDRYVDGQVIVAVNPRAARMTLTDTR